ncbi:AAA family ATPase [bacterium]|nr:AAA family ATPase [bacterium]
MYLEFFGLAVNPFSLSPKLEFLYKSDAFQESMAHLIYGVDNSEAITMITGAIGTGKTMSLQSFLANLGPNFRSALVTNTRVTDVELLKLILEDLEIRFPVGCDKSDLLILFKDFLLEANRTGCRVVIVIDEAQNLAKEVLEEVRLLTNLGQGDQQPVQVILVGQPELEAVVNQPQLAQLRQRIRVHYRLSPLSRKEVVEYLDHRMSVAGCRDKVFKPKAIDRIMEFSGGVPRLVNSLAGNALLSAFVAGRKAVFPEDVEMPEGTGEAPTVTSRSGPPPGAVIPPPPPPPPPPPSAQVSPEPAQAEPAFARYAAHRRPRKRVPVILSVILLLVLAAAVLFATGYLDGLIETVGSRIDARGGPAQVAALPATDEPSLVEMPESGPTDQVPPQDPPVQKEVEQDTVGPDAQGLDATGLTSPQRDQSPGEPPAAPVPARSAAVAAGGFYIHVESFVEIERAEVSLDRLARHGRHGVIRSELVKDEPYFRVYVGPFPDRVTAEEEVERLQTEVGLEYHYIRWLAEESGS